MTSPDQLRKKIIAGVLVTAIGAGAVALEVAKPNHKHSERPNGTMRGFVSFAKDLEKQPLHWKKTVSGEWALTRAAGGLIVETDIYTSDSRGPKAHALLNKPNEVDVTVYPRKTNIADLSPSPENEVPADSSYDIAESDGFLDTPGDLQVDSFDDLDNVNFEITGNTDAVYNVNQNFYTQSVEYEIHSAKNAVEVSRETEAQVTHIVHTASQAGNVLPYMQ